eukprot:scaffold109327_cov69-Phaeocystis_antarctica.AAC.1
MSVDVRTLHAAKTGRRTVYARPLRVPRARCPRPTGPPPSDVPATPLPWWRAHQQDEDLENSSVLPKAEQARPLVARLRHKCELLGQACDGNLARGGELGPERAEHAHQRGNVGAERGFLAKVLRHDLADALDRAHRQPALVGQRARARTLRGPCHPLFRTVPART